MRDVCGAGSDSAADTFIVEGHPAVSVLLAAGHFEILDLVIEAGRFPGLLARAAELGLKVREVPGETLRRDPGYRFHRGAFATVRRPAPRTPGETFWVQATRLLVPIDPADAGNLGTLLRSAVAFGIDGVVMEQGRGVDVYSRKSIRGSAGAVFRLPIFEVASLEHTLDRLGDAGFVLLGVSEGAASRPLGEVRAARKTAIVLGSESAGLPPGIERQCAELVHLPKREAADSHNIAVTGAILMWEWFGRVG